MHYLFNMSINSITDIISIISVQQGDNKAVEANGQTTVFREWDLQANHRKLNDLGPRTRFCFQKVNFSFLAVQCDHIEFLEN